MLSIFELYKCYFYMRHIDTNKIKINVKYIEVNDFKIV